MGGTKKATKYLEVAEGEGVFAIYGGPVGWSQ